MPVPSAVLMTFVWARRGPGDRRQSSGGGGSRAATPGADSIASSFRDSFHPGMERSSTSVFKQRSAAAMRRDTIRKGVTEAGERRLD